MAKINLLPWRDRLREKRKKEFIQTSGLAVMLGVFVVIVWSVVIGFKIEHQAARNDALKSEIGRLEKDIQEVQSLQKKRSLLVDRMNVIRGLQANRPLIVHIFDDLVKTLPEEVYYTSVVRTPKGINLEGVADSNDGVSALMRKLDASKYFKPPVLSDVINRTVKTKDGKTLNSSSFKLVVAEEGGAPEASTTTTSTKGATK